MSREHQASFLIYFSIMMIFALIIVSCSSTPIITRSTQTLPAETRTTLVNPTASAVNEEDRPLIPPETVTVQPAATQAPYLPSVPIWGIETYHLGVDDPGLGLIKQAGAYWVRRNALLWSKVETVPGERNWQALAGLESEMLAASSQGLQMILVVRSTPEWAQSLDGYYCSPPSAESLDEFGDFIHDAVRRYSVPPFNVQYWEIGNEPDVAAGLVVSNAPFGCWGKVDDPFYGGEYYAEILKAIYPQVKSANPQAQVLVGGLLLDCDPNNPPQVQPGSGELKDCTPARYLEGALSSGAGDFFDGISFHAYDYYGQKPGEYRNPNWNSAWNSTGPTLIAKANYLRNLLNQFDVAGKYLLNTESALLCGRDGSEPECQSDGFKQTKSYFLAESYVSAIAEQLTANIWYSLTGWRASGLVDSNFQPNQAYQAFTTSAASLNGAGFTGPLVDFMGVRGYTFDLKGKPLWVLWSLDGNEHTIQLDSLPLSIKDVHGSEIEPAEQITIGRAPMYIEFDGK